MANSSCMKKCKGCVNSKEVTYCYAGCACTTYYCKHKSEDVQYMKDEAISSCEDFIQNDNSLNFFVIGFFVFLFSASFYGLFLG